MYDGVGVETIEGIGELCVEAVDEGYTCVIDGIGVEATDGIGDLYELCVEAVADVLGSVEEILDDLAVLTELAIS